MGRPVASAGPRSVETGWAKIKAQPQGPGGWQRRSRASGPCRGTPSRTGLSRRTDHTWPRVDNKLIDLRQIHAKRRSRLSAGRLLQAPFKATGHGESGPSSMGSRRSRCKAGGTSPDFMFILGGLHTQPPNSRGWLRRLFSALTRTLSCHPRLRPFRRSGIALPC